MGSYLKMMESAFGRFLRGPSACFRGVWEGPGKAPKRVPLPEGSLEGIDVFVQPNTKKRIPEQKVSVAAMGSNISF